MMNNFWTSGSGLQPTGETHKAFVPEFSTIPNNTTAVAQIKAFEVVNKQINGIQQKFLQITWKIANGDFKGREVNQKIKPFEGSPEQIDRALNMLKLVMDLCEIKPTHAGEPTNQDLMKMHGKVCGIKIREWSMPKEDGSGMREGNFVAEVWPAKDFKVETGIKMETTVISHSIDTAFSRNPRSINLDDLDQDLPFV